MVQSSMCKAKISLFWYKVDLVALMAIDYTSLNTSPGWYAYKRVLLLGGHHHDPTLAQAGFSRGCHGPQPSAHVTSSLTSLSPHQRIGWSTLPDLHSLSLVWRPCQADCLAVILNGEVAADPLMTCSDQRSRLFTLIERSVAQTYGASLVQLDHDRAGYKEIYPVWIFPFMMAKIAQLLIHWSYKLPGGRFRNAYELLNLRALKSSMLHKFACENLRALRFKSS